MPAGTSAAALRRRRGRAAREPSAVVIVGAREHNLRVDYLEIPKRQLVVFTGVSGSGKSSMAFDTIFAEGQRRYIESLSAYARQFLGQLERPKVEHIAGLSPTIAIEQKSASNNPRSTVGTITEIYDYLRVLYARVGTLYCPECGKEVSGASLDEIVERILDVGEGRRAETCAPLVDHRKGEFRDLLQALLQRGFVRVRVDGQRMRIADVGGLDKRRKHTLELVVDRIRISARNRSRIAESVETALREGGGRVRLHHEGGVLEASTERSCCGTSFPELSPQRFSFNSPLGMCEACNGLGTRMEVDPARVVPDPDLSISEGAIAPWRSAMARGEGWTYRIAAAVARACDVDLEVPWKRLGKRKQRAVLYGTGGKRVRVRWGGQDGGAGGTWNMAWEGVIPALRRRFEQASSERAREHYGRYFAERPCRACDGQRLRPSSRAVRVAGKSIAEFTRMSVEEALRFTETMGLTGNAAVIAEGVVREIRSRLSFLADVGLGYLTLDRAGPSLSGGEAQRIRLASQLGSELSGVMYVLDEPSIGLHPRDNLRLIATLERLRDLGNSVFVVEHDEETIRAADHVVDFGPGAGSHGGKVVVQGTPGKVARSRKSLTGAYLAGRRRIEVPARRRTPTGCLTLRGVSVHNLRDLDVRFPLGVMVGVTGVSGAGKSSLVHGALLPTAVETLSGRNRGVGCRGAEGMGAIDKVVPIDQKPIGRTPRSNPGTYTKVFDKIRALFAETPLARARGYRPGRFSFNVPGGRCEACEGDGMVRVEMHFLADVYVPCEVCNGLRYNSQTLDVRYRGLSIADVLATPIEECRELFTNHPGVVRILDTLLDVGLGYVQLGQPAPTLSGGEAQRIKLSRELSRRSTGRTLYILDEPTTGLHFEDVRRLLAVLARLVDAGNTVVVIEHNLDVIKCCDYVIDLGPEGGDGGGRIVAEGTPEEVARAEGSYTGYHLARVLGTAPASG